MKNYRIILVFAISIAFLFPGAAFASAPQAPADLFTFSIQPSQAFAGETLAFTVTFDFVSGSSNSLCFYSNGSGVTYTFPAAATSQQGDSYTLDTTSDNCLASGLQAEYDLTSGTAGEFGDTLTLAVSTSGTVAATTIHTWQARQYNPTLVNRVNSAVQFLVSDTLYVANNSGACGANTPCLTGGDALDRALDYVDDSGGFGMVIVLGSYQMSQMASASLPTGQTVTLSGQSSASIGNDSGVCTANPMITSAGTLTVQDITLDGTCLSGYRSAGVEVTNGETIVKTSTLQDFGGSGVALVANGGSLLAHGNTFANNNSAMDGNGGTNSALYAFANNVNTNTGANAAVNIDSGDNVKCNYWGNAASAIAGSDATNQFAKRLGAAVVSYSEGQNAPVALGSASLPAQGAGNSQVLINLGRSTSSPPFRNGTTSGLGALVSDFYATCVTRSTSALSVVPVTVTPDAVTPGSNGFRLYEVMNAADCSPASNTACWDYAGVTKYAADPAPRSLSVGLASEGHFVVGNEYDPTAVSLLGFSARPAVDIRWYVALPLAGLLLTGAFLLMRRRWGLAKG